MPGSAVESFCRTSKCCLCCIPHTILQVYNISINYIHRTAIIPLDLYYVYAHLILNVLYRHHKGQEIGIREGSVLFKGPAVPQMCVSFKASLSTMAQLHPPIIPGTCFELYLYGTEVSRRLHSVVYMCVFDSIE